MSIREMKRTRSIEHLLRPNIRELKPYRSARHEFDGEARILLDANENPFDSGFNRYPDPFQMRLKEPLAKYKGVSPENIFLANGSDEAIDLLIRMFCRPGTDHILQLPPTFGMYRVAASLSAVEVREIALDEHFQPRVDAVLAAVDPYSKILFLCSPNNPTGNSLDRDRMRALIEGFPGIVAVDEAYQDFARQESALAWLEEYSNLLVLQTFSKAWGMAAIRLGMAFASKEIVSWLNKVKMPYNVNELTQSAALDALSRPERMEEQVAILLHERQRLERELPTLSLFDELLPSDANFILAKTRHSIALYRFLTERGVVVRDRSGVFPDIGAMRISVGLPEENDELLAGLRAFQAKLNA